MANVVIIQKLQTETTGTGLSTTRKKTADGEDELLVFPLLEDVTFDYSSEIGSMLDNIPGLSTITNIMSMINSFTALGGSTSSGNLSMEQLMDGPRWKKTNPVKFPVKILLYTKTDVYKDVWLQAKEFIEMSILKKVKESGGNSYYITPGLNLNDLDAANNSAKKDVKGLKGNYISIEIPGMVYLPMAFIEKVTPVFSKEVCKSNNPKFGATGKNFPIWCELELSVTGVYPATSEFLDMVADDSERPAGLQKPASGKATATAKVGK